MFINDWEKLLISGYGGSYTYYEYTFNASNNYTYTATYYTLHMLDLNVGLWEGCNFRIEIRYNGQTQDVRTFNNTGWYRIPVIVKPNDYIIVTLKDFDGLKKDIHSYYIPRQ